MQEAMDETFLLTNIAPQVGDGFNRHCEHLLYMYELLSDAADAQTGHTSKTFADG